MMGKCIGLRPIRGTFALGKKYNRSRLYKGNQEKRKNKNSIKKKSQPNIDIVCVFLLSSVLFFLRLRF